MLFLAYQNTATMTESLFDTNFATEPKTEAPESSEADHSYEHTSSTTLPVLEGSPGPNTITFRVLVSAKEAGCLIGQNGQVIDSIREETHTRAGISKLQPGSHERILTVTGLLDESAKALSYFAQALVNSNNENTSAYSFFPLKQLSLIPNIEGETTILRLLVPNSQMGTLIGSKGLRIQQIQQNYNVLMIASKSFLPGLNERLVELQGTVDNLYDVLRIISRCLMEDISSAQGTVNYVPRGGRNAASAGSRVAPGDGNSGRVISTSVSFPNDIVGALIGKNGSRIQGVRKVSGATIGISDEVEGKDERIFTITGTSFAVDKAKDLLYHNLEREEQRRQEAEE